MSTLAISRFLVVGIFVLLLPFIASAEPAPELFQCNESISSVVTVDATSPLTQSLPRLSMPFQGTLKNTASFPIINGQVWLEIYKVKESADISKKMNERQLVETTVVLDEVLLPAGASQKFDFEWQVPSNAQSGEYEAFFSFGTDYEFNTNVEAQGLPFSIVGEEIPASFETTYMLNETSYKATDELPHFSKTTPVVVVVELTNPSDIERIVEMTWVTRGEGPLREESEIERSSTGVVIAPHETKEFSYTPSLTNTSLVHVQAIAQDGDAMSILNIKFIRDGYIDTRFTFNSISSYPFMMGNESTLYSCIETNDASDSSDLTIVTTVTNASGDVVYTNERAVKADASVAQTFIPETTLKTFTVNSTLMKNGLEIDRIAKTYICEDMKHADCSEVTAQAVESKETQTPLYMYLIYTALGIVLGYFSVLFYRRGHIKMHIPE